MTGKPRLDPQSHAAFQIVALANRISASASRAYLRCFGIGVMEWRVLALAEMRLARATIWKAAWLWGSRRGLPVMDQDAVSEQPPSTCRIAPVMKLASWENRKAMAFAMSSSVPNRPSGVLRRRSS